ncbi:MAG: two-component system sensor histidine kinase NtrB [Candidatus Binatia bacterium]
MNSTTSHPDRAQARRRILAARWWGAGAGFLLAIFDTLLLSWLGVRIEWNGYDATLANGAFMSTSYALLGFLVGYAIEARHRDQRSARVIQAQTEAIAATRARLLQSEKLAALGQLATAIAHEVRNPLGVIRSAAQSVSESLAEGDAEGRRSCEFIIAETDRLSSVVSSLLAFARPLQLKPRAVAVGELVERAVLLAGQDLESKHVRIVRGGLADLPSVQADPDLLCQVLLGLFANASDVLGDGGEVSVGAETENGAVAITVADSGPGVPAELRERIFEPFFTTRSRGVGLGLAIARQIIEAHGGRIDVGERPGGGARFTVSLPIAVRAEAA